MLHKIYRFKSKVEVYAEAGSFVLKTVTDSEELLQALRLRYQVFHREMKGVEKPRGVDVDEFDFACDHLIIVERNSNIVVGTYRLNCSEFSKKFYSQNEFKMDKVLNRTGVKIELGRACIAKEYRRGFVISLLWKGIAEYMRKVNGDYLFGCASILTSSPQETALIYRYLEERNYFTPEFYCPPQKGYTMPNLDLWLSKTSSILTESEITFVEEKIPPLCRAYMRAGANFGGEPAWDADFNCIDFLTILPREQLNKTLGRKLNLCQPQPVAQAMIS